MSWLSALDRRVFAPVPARRVFSVRAALAVIIGARLAHSSYRDLAEMPGEIFSPPWFLTWLDVPPPEAVIVGLQLAGLAAAGAVVVTRGRRALPFALAWGALMVLGGLETSGGKILHNDVLLLLGAMPFVVRSEAPTETDSGPSLSGWQPRTAMVVVSLGYCLAGLMKLRHSGIEWVFSENLRWVLYSGARSTASVLPGVARAVAGQLWLTVLLAGATVLVEVLFPLAVLWRRARVWLATGAISLHVGVFLFLGLDYWTWVAVVAIFFLPWDRVVERPATQGAAYASVR